MKVEASNISLISQHASSTLVTTAESLRRWVGQQQADSADHPAGNTSALSTFVNISAAGQQAASLTTNFNGDVSSDPRLLPLINLIEAITGQKVKLFNPKDLTTGGVENLTTGGTTPGQQVTKPPQRQGWGLQYDKQVTTHQSELTTFSTQGAVKTSDGQEIKFNLSLSMQSEFTRESGVWVSAGDAVKKDPLAINFNGTAAQLTDSKFSFDLEGNGNKVNISFVGSDSGFLALDKNGNGSIDSGSELFGTKSGNGFADLAAYDKDGNHWIDENDAIFSKLKVWSKDASGAGSLSTLAQCKIGAIYLGNTSTPFDLKNNVNNLQGQIRSTGIYLHDDGSAGTLQQVDLVI